MALTDLFSGIADAIRTKDGTTDGIEANAFPLRILNIPSGGGNELPSFIKMGTVTFAENINTVTIEHGGSEKPYFATFVIEDTNTITTTYTDALNVMFVDNNDEVKFTTAYGSFNSGVANFGASGTGYDITNETITFVSRNETYSFKAGYTYRWICLFHNSEG